jgi:chromosome segregation ATPase
MKRIVSEQTSLQELGMSVDMILAGDNHVEVEPEPKPNRKEKYLRYDFATKIMDAYGDDLLNAYRVIEELEAENESLQEQLETATEAANKSAKQVRSMLAKDKDIREAEALLAKFENQMALFAKDKQMDKETIQALQEQVSELIALKETVPQLEEAVNQVLANLQMYLEEEGIEMGDLDDDYDEYEG